MAESKNGLSLDKLIQHLQKNDPDTKHQAHGMTVSEMRQLKEKQANQDDLETIEPNCPDVAKKYPDYKVYKHEQHLVHVVLEKRQFDQDTGKKLSTPKLMKFYPNDFNQMAKSTINKGDKVRPQNAFGAYNVIDIIHDPRQKKEPVKTNQADASRQLTEMRKEELREVYQNIVMTPSTEEEMAAFLAMSEDQLLTAIKAAQAAM